LTSREGWIVRIPNRPRNGQKPGSWSWSADEAGSTLFDWGIGHAVVDATGLVEGQDYFFV
jgi:hypothetical protein